MSPSPIDPLGPLEFQTRKNERELPVAVVATCRECDATAECAINQVGDGPKAVRHLTEHLIHKEGCSYLPSPKTNLPE